MASHFSARVSARISAPVADWVMLQPTVVPGASLLRAHFVRHQFERQSHETWSIGVTFDGNQTFRCRGATTTSWRGNVTSRGGSRGGSRAATASRPPRQRKMGARVPRF